MTTFQQERFIDIIQEAFPLIKEHKDEVGIFKDKIRLFIDIAKYIILEHQNKLFILSCRDENKELIGYTCFIVDTHLHYRDKLVAVNDALFLQKEHRKGLLGYKLIKKSEEELIKLGVHIISWRSKLGEHDFSLLMTKLNYIPNEITYIKLVKDKEI
jgi:hypothetical protein